MEPVIIGILGIVILLIAILLGIHVGVALGVVGFMGLWWLSDNFTTGLGLLTTSPWSRTAQYAFTCLPMFILMGIFASHSGISEQVFDAANRWLGRLPGGLAVATTVGNAAFGAVTGSSLVAVAVFTKVAFPQMLRFNYSKRFAAGAIAAGGMLGMLIPPSILMVVYGIITQTSIGHLLIGGIGPGLLLTALFCILSFSTALLWPHMAPRADIGYTLKEKIVGMKGTAGVVILAAIIVGGIYTGIFTPTEGGAAGAFGAFLIALAMRKLTWPNFIASLKETAQTTCMIFLIVIGAMVFGKFLALSTLSIKFAEWVGGSGIPPLAIVGIFVVMFLALGCFLDSTSILFITLPVMHPVILSLHLNEIWFAMVAIMAVECGLLTPPLGINVYTLKAVAGDEISLNEVFLGCIPFFFAALSSVVILMFVPIISTWIPSHMLG